MYTNDPNVTIGSYGIFRTHDPERFKDMSIRKRLQSDHLALVANIDFETVESLRTPMIQKERMIRRIWALKGKELKKAKNNPI